MPNAEDHKGCRIAYRSDFNNQVRECDCSCHEGKEKPEIPAEFNLKPEAKTRRPNK